MLGKAAKEDDSDGGDGTDDGTDEDVRFQPLHVVFFSFLPLETPCPVICGVGKIV